MGTLQGKKGTSGNGARRFEPSSEARTGPVLTQVDEGRPSAPAEREKLGRQVAARRAELGLTHRDLAKRMDVSRGTIARIEKGEPQSTETLMRLTKALRPGGGTELQGLLESELVLRGAISGSVATSRSLGRGRPSMPNLSMLRLSRPRMSRPRIPMPRISLNRRWLLGLLAAIAVVAVVTVVAIASAGDGGGDDPAPQADRVVSPPPVAPPPAAEPQENARKAKAERNAAPVSDSDESSSSEESSSEEPSSEDESTPTTDDALDESSPPVSNPSPAPSSSQPNRPRPSIQHGINPGG